MSKKNKPVDPIKKGPCFTLILCAFFLFKPACLKAAPDFPCMDGAGPSDAILITSPDGGILYRKNETMKCIPASTFKILTALTAIYHLGLNYRFRTEFFIDHGQNLIIKGYGDPLLISEVWRQIADDLSTKIRKFNDLILDNTYFSKDLTIPGTCRSTNPYDAPSGALCANFNTVFFDHDPHGMIISAEPQTPITPFAREKIRHLGLKKGRYTFTRDQGDAARYAGELLLYFLAEKGVVHGGKIRLGAMKPDAKLIHTHLSGFPLSEVIKKTMAFSNNFMANQICIALGAHVHGPPGTLEKGVRVVSDHAKKKLRLDNVTVVEGSGISRKNRISALDMGAILDRFKPYRHLLKKKGNLLYKTGTLKGVNTRAGYIENPHDSPGSFVIFLNKGNSDIDALMECVEKSYGKFGR